MQYIKKSGIVEQMEHDQNKKAKKSKRRGRAVVLFLMLGLIILWVFNPFDSSPQNPQIPEETADSQANGGTPAKTKQDILVQEVLPITTLENEPLPITLVSTEEFALLDKAGKPVTIPAGSIIIVESRDPVGTLITRINGDAFVGNENRLSGKAKVKTD